MLCMKAVRNGVEQLITSNYFAMYSYKSLCVVLYAFCFFLEVTVELYGVDGFCSVTISGFRKTYGGCSLFS